MVASACGNIWVKSIQRASLEEGGKALCMNYVVLAKPQGFPLQDSNLFLNFTVMKRLPFVGLTSLL